MDIQRSLSLSLTIALDSQHCLAPECISRISDLTIWAAIARLCYAMQCYAMLHYAMLRYAMLSSCDMLCSALLSYAVLRYAMLREEVCQLLREVTAQHSRGQDSITWHGLSQGKRSIAQKSKAEHNMTQHSIAQHSITRHNILKRLRANICPNIAICTCIYTYNSYTCR